MSKIPLGSRGAQLVKCLLCRHEEPSVIPQHKCKKSGMVAHAVIPVLERPPLSQPEQLHQ